ncbi:MAG: DoxX family protein [Bacteroidetes bacterium]|nr:DoxX family protein [Bacteroidota bacterium]MCL1969449.1 DoxX family protein [Bacteroidota bacterium]
MRSDNKYLSTVLRIFTGLVFVASAILKYISIDLFDLYIFEHNLFSVSVTETLTRLLVTAELVLGILLILNIHVRLAYYCALGFLAGFTIYLLLLPRLFDVDIINCHCFGTAIVLSRTESIAKNVVLLLCLFFVSPKFSTYKKWHTWVMIALGIITITVLMVVNAPNYLYSIVHKDKIQIDVPVYESALLNSGKEVEFTDGKQIICMFSAGCRYCKHAALKLHLIMKNHHLSEEHVKAIFWTGTPDSIIHNFFAEQRMPLIEYTTFRVDTFLTVTSGSMPLILFSDNGTIVQRYNYISLNENRVVDFLKSE